MICKLKKNKNKTHALSFCFHRVDHLYTFFVQWSPEIYTKGNKKRRQPHYHIREKHQKRYLVVEKNKVAVMNKLLSNPVNPTANNWEVRFALTHTHTHTVDLRRKQKPSVALQLQLLLGQDNKLYTVQASLDKNHQVSPTYSKWGTRVLGSYPRGCGKSHCLYIWTSYLPPSLHFPV